METDLSLKHSPVTDAEKQPYSAGLPSIWLTATEAVFEQLAIHYGAARMSAHWAGISPEKAKLYWARQLMRLPRRSIGFALQNLPKMPPSIGEFCEIARRCPPQPFVALPFIDTPEVVQHRRDRVASIRQQFFGARAPDQVTREECPC